MGVVRELAWDAGVRERLRRAVDIALVEPRLDEKCQRDRQTELPAMLPRDLERGGGVGLGVHQPPEAIVHLGAKAGRDRKAQNRAAGLGVRDRLVERAVGAIEPIRERQGVRREVVSGRHGGFLPQELAARQRSFGQVGYVVRGRSGHGRLEGEVGEDDAARRLLTWTPRVLAQPVQAVGDPRSQRELDASGTEELELERHRDITVRIADARQLGVEDSDRLDQASGEHQQSPKLHSDGSTTSTIRHRRECVAQVADRGWIAGGGLGAAELEQELGSPSVRRRLRERAAQAGNRGLWCSFGHRGARRRAQHVRHP